MIDNVIASLVTVVITKYAKQLQAIELNSNNTKAVRIFVGCVSMLYAVGSAYLSGTLADTESVQVGTEILTTGLVNYFGAYLAYESLFKDRG